MDYYYFSLCHVCKKSSPELKKCSSCRVLYYCSREHQLEDWPKHKKLCKAITTTNKILPYPARVSAEDFDRFKYSSALLWQVELGRPLDLVEHHMWMFPKVCTICYSPEVTLTCEKCLSVAYCSKEHQNSHQELHEKYCDSFKLCLTIHQITTTSKAMPNVFKFKVDENVKSLPDGPIEKVLNLMGYKAEPDFSKKYVDFVILSELFSPAINITYGLEKSGFIENRRGKKPILVIHVVGAEAAESNMCWSAVFEFLSHWITNLKAVKMFLIGPALERVPGAKFTFDCAHCQQKGFKGTVCSLPGYYHDNAHLSLKPDLVVAFNCGLSEFCSSAMQDTWKKSIPKLIYFRGVPAILTAYIESELKEDIARFPQSRIKFFIEPQRNLYASLWPMRNWEVGGEPIYYRSNYIAVITKK